MYTERPGLSQHKPNQLGSSTSELVSLYQYSLPGFELSNVSRGSKISTVDGVLSAKYRPYY